MAIESVLLPLDVNERDFLVADVVRGRRESCYKVGYDGERLLG